MTTVIDLLGTPVPTYNRSGTVIISLSVAAMIDGNLQPPTDIPSVAGWTVVLVTALSSNCEVRLPASAEIGDLIEIHKVNSTGSLTVRAPSGEAFSPQMSGEIAAGRLFRRVSDTLWVAVGPADGHP